MKQKTHFNLDLMLNFGSGLKEVLYQYAKNSTLKKIKKKKKYKFQDKRNWKQYNSTLVKRGEFYINPRFLETWIQEIKELNLNKVGQPFLYPQSMIEFLSILHSKGFDYRALEGIMSAFSKRLGNFPVLFLNTMPILVSMV